MNLPVGEGVSVIYALSLDWTHRRDLISVLGGAESLEQVDEREALLRRRPALRRRAGAARLAEVVAFVDEAGGEMG